MTDQVDRSASTMRAMRIGVHVTTGVLLAVGTVRALSAGAQPAAVVAVAVLFAGWYCAGVVLAAPSRRRASGGGLGQGWWLGGLAVVWVAMLVVSPEFTWLAFPLWLLAGFLLQQWAAILFALLVLAAVIVAPMLHGRELTTAEMVGPVIGGLFAFGIARAYVALARDATERARLLRSLVAAQAETAGLQDELAAAQRESGVIAERTRLSRDIHDTIAQSLTSILLLARADAPSAEGARALHRIETLAQESLADVRRIVSELAPAELDEQALPGALRRLLARLSDETGIDGVLHVDDEFPVLPTAVEVALLRTAQSALANVRRHSGADRVVVSLSVLGPSVRMDVVDDGTGFDVD